jgi:hypothetical protein
MVYSCSYSGLLLSHTLKIKNLAIIVILIIALYYGYPLIEACLLILPIPDPKDVKENIKAIFFSVKEENVKKGYKEGFGEAPETLGDEDDDEDDVGKPMTSQKKDISYDSDEDKSGAELIDLDGGSSKEVPKISKPV